MGVSSNILLCEERIGYAFKNHDLLQRALTHRSWAHERIASGRETEVRNLHNEAFEFVGDSVLGLVIAEALFEKFPDSSEGELSLMKHRLVSATTLREIAEEIELSRFIRIGRGEERSGGRRKAAILADAVEAVIAAVFFDGGYPAAQELVRRLYAEILKNATPTSSVDYKTMLQEHLQADKRQAPVYTVVRTEGPPHSRTFYVEASWDTGAVEGCGSSIKTAEMAAAKVALEILGNSAETKETKDEEEDV